MGQTAFSKAEARAKIGRRVRPRIAVAEAPRGAVGAIIRADRVLDGYDVEASWVCSGRRTPRVDWLTQGEYEAHLVELPARGGGL